MLTTPVIRGVKQQFSGGAKVHFLTKAVYASLLEHNPHIDRLHTMQERVTEVMPTLREIGFEYVIDLHNNLRSRLVRNGLKAIYFTFPKLNVQKWVLVNFKIDRMPDVHIVDRYRKAVSFFDIQPDDQGLEVVIAPEDEVDLATLPESHRNGYVGLRHWRQSRYQNFTSGKNGGCVQGHSLSRVVCWVDRAIAKKEMKLFARRATMCTTLRGNFLLCNRLSLVKQAFRVLAHDTGLMHIAAAFGQHIVSLWGNTVPQLGMTPYLPAGKGKSIIIQVEGLGCRPCSKLGFEKCPKKHFNCMNLIDEAEVVEALELPASSVNDQ